MLQRVLGHWRTMGRAVLAGLVIFKHFLVRFAIETKPELLQHVPQNLHSVQVGGQTFRLTESPMVCSFQQTLKGTTQEILKLCLFAGAGGGQQPGPMQLQPRAVLRHAAIVRGVT